MPTYDEELLKKSGIAKTLGTAPGGQPVTSYSQAPKPVALDRRSNPGMPQPQNQQARGDIEVSGGQRLGPAASGYSRPDPVPLQRAQPGLSRNPYDAQNTMVAPQKPAYASDINNQRLPSAGPDINQSIGPRDEAQAQQLEILRRQRMPQNENQNPTFLGYDVPTSPYEVGQQLREGFVDTATTIGKGWDHLGFPVRSAIGAVAAPAMEVGAGVMGLENQQAKADQALAPNQVDPVYQDEIMRRASALTPRAAPDGQNKPLTPMEAQTGNPADVGNNSPGMPPQESAVDESTAQRQRLGAVTNLAGMDKQLTYDENGNLVSGSYSQKGAQPLGNGGLSVIGGGAEGMRRNLAAAEMMKADRLERERSRAIDMSRRNAISEARLAQSNPDRAPLAALAAQQAQNMMTGELPQDKELARIGQTQANRAATQQAQIKADAGVQEARIRAASDANKKSTRPLPNTSVKELSSMAGTMDTFGRLGNTFQNDFAGSGFEWIGSLENWAGRVLPAEMFATKGQAQWWQDYQYEANQIRNSLFGAALTAAELAAFKQAMITPNMQGSQIRENLARQKQILQGGAARYAAAQKANGYSEEAIIGSLGFDPFTPEMQKLAQGSIGAEQQGQRNAQGSQQTLQPTSPNPGQQRINTLSVDQRQQAQEIGERLSAQYPNMDPDELADMISRELGI